MKLPSLATSFWSIVGVAVVVDGGILDVFRSSSSSTGAQPSAASNDEVRYRRRHIDIFVVLVVSYSPWRNNLDVCVLSLIRMHKANDNDNNKPLR
jgi:hypothetical protein